VTVPGDDSRRTVTDDDVRGLLARAYRLGLRVVRSGEKLRVEGHKNLEPLAKEILSKKVEVLAFLRAHPAHELDGLTAKVIQAFQGEIVEESPGEARARAVRLTWEAGTGRCFTCDGSLWWKRIKPEGPWICEACHPPQVDEDQIARMEVP